MGQYNEIAAKEIYENALKYAGKQKDWDWEEHHVIDARKIACHLLIEQIKRFLDNLKIKGHIVTIKEYSNVRPELCIHLPYTDTKGYISYDKMGLYFDRDHYLFEDDTRLMMPNARMWLPQEWWYYLNKVHKKNQLIFNELQKEFPIKRIGMLLNWPFVITYDNEDWPFIDHLNIT